MIWLSLLVLAGLVLLVFGGDILVRGAVAMSLRLGIPALVVSLTVVALGTSAPELIVAVQAALAGAGGLAIGNVVGSNVANIWLVLGVPAVIASIHASGVEIKRSFGIMFVVTILFIILGYMGPFGIGHGLILLTVFALVMIDTFRITADAPEADVDDLPEVDPNSSWGKIIAFILLGFVCLPIGAELLIRGATGIAANFGLPDAIIGLTIVAIGTSLPELATTVTAAYRRHTDVILGNVIGSNMFNILVIMGVASLFGPIELPVNFLAYDFWVMVVAALTIVPFVIFGARLGKRWGIVFVLIYLLYIASIVITHQPA